MIKRHKLLIIIIIIFYVNSSAQMATLSGLRPFHPDTTSMFCQKYYWNLSRIVNMIDWIDNNIDGCTDSVLVSEFKIVNSKLKAIKESRLNYSLLDSEIYKLYKKIIGAIDDNFIRCSPFKLIKQEILSKHPDEIDLLLLEGIKYKEKCKIDSAYIFFKNAVEKDSSRLNYYYYLFYSELECNKDTIKALTYINKVINENSVKINKAFNPYHIRANIYMNQNLFSLANDDLNFILSNDSNDLNSLFCRAYVKTKMKDYLGSISDYQLLLQKYCNIPFRSYIDTFLVFNNIGWNYYNLKEYDLCVQFANRSFLLGKSNALFLDTRGSGYFGLCEYEKCIADMTRVIELSSDFSNSYYLRGLSYLKLNIQDMAYFDLLTAFKMGVSEAADYLKNLSPPVSYKNVESLKTMPGIKNQENGRRFRIDPYGFHFYLK